MTDTRFHLPQMLSEDYVRVLGRLVILAWLAVAGMAGTEIWIRAGAGMAWPRFGGFSAMYHGVLLELTLVTVMLTWLLVQRDWYEHVPRSSLYRLRWLLLAVLIWGGLHLFAAFHVSGALAGPLALLLPVMLVAVLTAIPGPAGWLLAAYLLAGHAAVLLLQHCAVIAPVGELTAAFAYQPDPAPLGLGTLAVVAALTFATAAALRYRLFPAGTSLHPARRIDWETGLYRRVFLVSRLGAELARTRRQGASMALMLMRLDGETGRPDDERLRAMAALLIPRLRHESDTPARFGPRALAILLPAADDAGARKLGQRLLQQLTEAGPERGLRAALVVTDGQGLQPADVLQAAEQALRSASTADSLVVSVAQPSGAGG